MRKLLTLIAFAISFHSFSQTIPTRFELSKGKESPTYPQIIEWWKSLDEKFPQVKMQEIGQSDAGFPLHLITVSNDSDFDFGSLRRKNRRIIM